MNQRGDLKDKTRAVLRKPEPAELPLTKAETLALHEAAARRFAKVRVK